MLHVIDLAVTLPSLRRCRLVHEQDKQAGDVRLVLFASFRKGVLPWQGEWSLYLVLSCLVCQAVTVAFLYRSFGEGVVAFSTA